MRVSIRLALVLAAFFGVAVACHAQTAQTWVSGVGDDANPCSRTAPCQTFAGAISKTAAGGEITCLDPGNFGAVTITKPITILCDSTSNGGVLVSGTNGIAVNLPTATYRVVLSGLDLEGLGAGLSGVLVDGLGTVIIRNSTIRDFTVAAVNLQGASGTPATRLVVQHCVLTNSRLAVHVAGASGTANSAEILDTLAESNTRGISVGQGGTLTLSNSVISGQTSAISISGNGQVVSYGNNVITNTGAPTSTVPLK